MTASKKWYEFVVMADDDGDIMLYHGPVYDNVPEGYVMRTGVAEDESRVVIVHIDDTIGEWNSDEAKHAVDMAVRAIEDGE